MKSTSLWKLRFNLLHNFAASLREMGKWAALHCALHHCMCPPPFVDGFSPLLHVQLVSWRFTLLLR